MEGTGGQDEGTRPRQRRQDRGIKTGTRAPGPVSRCWFSKASVHTTSQGLPAVPPLPSTGSL